MEKNKYGYANLSRLLAKLRSSPALSQIMHIVLYAFSSFAASTARINGEYAPFGVILAASAGNVPSATAAAIGAFFGYLTVWQRVDSLKYISALIIISSVRMMFPGKSEKDRYFMPYISCAALSVVGFVYLSSKGINVYDFSMFITESALCFFLCGLFHDTIPGLFSGKKTDEFSLLGTAAFGGIMLLASVKVALFFGMTLGGVLCCIILLCASYYGNMGAAALGAVVSGSIMAAGGRVEWSFALGLSAIVSSIFSKHSRLAASSVFVLCNATVMVWFSDTQALLAATYEVFLGSVCFLIMPVSIASAVGQIWTLPKRDTVLELGKHLLRQRLSAVAQGFELLSRSMSPEDNIEKLKVGIDSGRSFDFAADSVCRKCSLAMSCWQKDSSYTYGCLCDSAPKIMTHLEAKVEHFPIHFIEKCKRIDEFVAAINQNLLLQKMGAEKIIANPSACGFISTSFHELSETIKKIPNDSKLIPYAPIQDKLELFFAKNPSYSHGGAASVDDGILYVSLFSDWQELNQATAAKELSSCVGRQLEPVYSSPYPLFRETLPIEAQIGTCARKRPGERENGDFFLTFEQGNFQYMIMTDGMGSGKMAAVKSRTAANVIKCYLKAGLSPETALQAVDSSLFIKEGGGFFVTADIAVIDRKNGRCDVYKIGAPPTFIKRSDKLITSGATGLPLGLGGKIYHRQHRIQPGGLIVMITDGIALYEDREEWKKLILSFDSADSQTIADTILDKSQLKDSRKDDMTVAVAAIR